MNNTESIIDSALYEDEVECNYVVFGIMKEKFAEDKRVLPPYSGWTS